ncbi:MAG: Ig-like domain-containing protein [Candidatus Omnitrophica bacterium]|nr:Ig-like domain-containing protein [Candidatus Omnitrophota bacterium]
MKANTLENRAPASGVAARSRLVILVGILSWAVSGSAGLSLLESGGTFLPGNLATQGIAFGLDEEGDPYGQIILVNDGTYGVSSRWAGASDVSFVGINLNGSYKIDRIAFGANNAGFNIRFERYLAVYTLQYTTVAAPDALTPDNDWVTVGILDYVNQAPPDGPVRHLYQLPAVEATGVRIIVDNVMYYGDYNRPAIDEIEVYPTLALAETGGEGGTNNLARAGTAFGKDEEGAPYGQIIKANDGVYGNDSSWVGTSSPTFIGIDLKGTHTIDRIGFGRDNTGASNDRYAGTYTLQYTAVATPDQNTPDSSWATIGVLDYINAAPTNAALRHVYQFAPVRATGVRLIAEKPADGLNIAVDELEAYPFTPKPGNLTLVETGGTAGTNNLALTATAFGKDEEGAPYGQIVKVNDGIYGNDSSWIGTSQPTFVGVRFDGTNKIDRIAFGRDNTGTLSDRYAGTYYVQYTSVPFPDETTPGEQWLTIDVLDYVHAPPPNPAQRHVYSFIPVNATGVRIICEKPDDGLNIGIDELEVYPALPPEPSFTLAETGGTFAEGNIATAGIPFGKDEEGAPYGQIIKINDGMYGNESSWVGITRPTFVGINLQGLHKIDRIAFGRDNTLVHADRNAGTYTIQFTTVSDPDKTTPDGDWETIGVLDYESEPPPDPASRHLYSFTPVFATGIRIVTLKPVDGLNIAIDEIELYEATGGAPPPTIADVQPADGASFVSPSDPIGFSVTSVAGVAPTGIALVLNGADVSSQLAITGDNSNRAVTYTGLTADTVYTVQITATDVAGSQTTKTISFNTYSRNQAVLIETGGEPGANNLAMVGTAFGKDEEGAPYGQILKVNDGIYGNDSSWVGTSRPTFIGINLNGATQIDRIAFGRDNTGALSDRYAGTYTFQYTMAPDPSAATPDADWTTFEVLDYDATPPPDPALRHLYQFTPFEATGVRIIALKPAGGLNIAIDELEVYGIPAGPRLGIEQQGSNVIISWTGAGTLQEAVDVMGPWTTITEAASPYTATMTSERKFYRLVQ